MDEITALDTPAESMAGQGDSTNLYGVIDRDHVHGLNLTVPEDARDLIKPWNERESTVNFVDSGVDDEIIIHVPFTQNVRVRSVLLKLGRGELAPRHMKIYANVPSGIDFEDTENTKAQMDITLLDGQDGVTEYPLRVAAFANVFALSLFFSEAAGDETSRIYFIGFKGETRTPTKDTNTTIDIPAANAADAPLNSVREEAAGRHTTIR